MKPISVIVPTANQPEFLETALSSIARQTAGDEIGEVLVSENLKNRASEAVCRKFSELPIRYTFQDPPLTQQGNFEYLFRQTRGELVALICDDDWWAPGHLQGALNALRRDAEAVAWFSNCLYVESEMGRNGWLQRPTALWLAAGRPSCSSLWRLERDQVLATAWILTPFHNSTIVVRRETLLSAAPAYFSSHSYQADRSLHAALAIAGPLLYEPLVDAFIRWHPAALARQLSNAEREFLFRECTEKIRTSSLEAGLDVVSAWHGYLSNVTREIAEEVGVFFRRAMDDERLAEYGLQRFILPSFPVRALRRVSSLAKREVLRVVGW